MLSLTAVHFHFIFLVHWLAHMWQQLLSTLSCIVLYERCYTNKVYYYYYYYYYKDNSALQLWPGLKLHTVKQGMPTRTHADGQLPSWPHKHSRELCLVMLSWAVASDEGWQQMSRYTFLSKDLLCCEQQRFCMHREAPHTMSREHCASRLRMKQCSCLMLRVIFHFSMWGRGILP